MTHDRSILVMAWGSFLVPHTFSLLQMPKNNNNNNSRITSVNVIEVWLPGWNFVNPMFRSHLFYQDEASATVPSAVLRLQGSVPSFWESAALWRNFSTAAMWLQLPHHRRQQILGLNGCSGGGSVDRLPVKTDPKPRCFQLLGHTGTSDKTVHSSLLHIRFTWIFYTFRWETLHDQFQPFILKGICNLRVDTDWDLPSGWRSGQY